MARRRCSWRPWTISAKNWEQRSIFYTDEYVTSRQQFIDFDRKGAIKLQNYIGTVIFRGEQLNIFPKVFKEDEDDFDTSGLEIGDLINNLVIWLGYCDRLNFPFVSMKSELGNTDNLLELFITVYTYYVKAAIDIHSDWRPPLCVLFRS